RCPQPLQGCADQIRADARTLPLEVGHAKCSLRLPDRSSDEFRLLSSRRSRLSETFLELLISGLENEQREIDVRPRIVSAIVPAPRTEFERLVVAMLMLLDQPLEADVPPDVVAEMVGL